MACGLRCVLFTTLSPHPPCYLTPLLVCTATSGARRPSPHPIQLRPSISNSSQQMLTLSSAKHHVNKQGGFRDGKWKRKIQKRYDRACPQGDGKALAGKIRNLSFLKMPRSNYIIVIVLLINSPFKKKKGKKKKRKRRKGRKVKRKKARNEMK